VGGDGIRDTREHCLGAAGDRVDVRAGSGEDLLNVGFALLLDGGQSGEKWSLYRGWVVVVVRRKVV
jgi:hypothetical protein